jgi:hypothetical protein
MDYLAYDMTLKQALEGFPEPSVYRLPDGRARAEWTNLPYEIALTVSKGHLKLDVFDRDTGAFVFDDSVTVGYIRGVLGLYLGPRTS